MAETWGNWRIYAAVLFWHIWPYCDHVRKGDPEQGTITVRHRRRHMRDSRTHNYPPRWNGAPSQELLVIRRNHETGQVSLDPLRWGLTTRGFLKQDLFGPGI